MTATTTATRAVTSALVDDLMALGAELPMTIAQMDTLQRFTTVGALYAAGELPSEEIATALLFEPQNVLMIPVEVFELARAETAPDDGGFLTETYVNPEGVRYEARVSVEELARAQLAAEIAETDAVLSDPETLTAIAEALSETGSVVYPRATTDPMLPFETVPAQDDTGADLSDAYAALDADIYECAQRLVTADPSLEPFVSGLLEALGMSWPQPTEDTSQAA